MDILIAVPTFENIAPETFKSIYDLEKIPGVNFEFEFVKGYDCAVARNAIIKKAAEGLYSYVLMVDSDIILPKDAITNLLSDNKDVVLGYYPRKDESEISEIFRLGNGYSGENRITISELVNAENILMPINGGGFGCAFIRMNLFNRINQTINTNKPSCFNYITYPDGDRLSEDLYFCSLVRRNGIPIYVDTRVRCKHIGRIVIL